MNALTLRRAAACLIGVALIGAPISIAADPAKQASSSERSKAKQRFEGFAASWLSDLRKQEQQARRAGQNHIGPGEDFTLELRSTGSAGAPYVGILHYTEHNMRCSGANACQRTGTSHVSEIFRYQKGKWIY